MPRTDGARVLADLKRLAKHIKIRIHLKRCAGRDICSAAAPTERVRMSDEQIAAENIRRGDHRVGEVEGDPALLRAELDTRGYRPAPLPYVPAAVLLDHEYVFAFGCGRDRQVGGELGQLAERPG